MVKKRVKVIAPPTAKKPPPPPPSLLTSANVSMAGKRIVDMAPGIAPTDAATVSQITGGGGGGFTQLTGDVTTAVGSGVVPTTVALVGGKTAAQVAASVNATLAATSLNTINTIVKRDGAGNFAASNITATLLGNATTATTAVNFSGSLAGDVTGTQGATSILSTVVTGKLLTGYVVGTNTPLTAAMSVLTAFENLQAQINSVTVVGVSPNVEYRTLTSGEAAAKQLTLAATPFVATKTLLDPIGGSAQEYAVDYTVTGAVLSWSTLGLDGILSTGDVLRIIYWT